MAKKPQIPLADVMLAIDRKNRSWYDNLNDEQKKAFSAWMMMRYCSSVQGRDAANYIYLTNELVNFQFMEVSKHPELQWLLLSACGTGKSERNCRTPLSRSNPFMDLFSITVNRYIPDSPRRRARIDSVDHPLLNARSHALCSYPN